MKRVLFVLVLWALYGSSYSQVTMEINVLDLEEAKVIPGISVTLENEQIGYKSTKITNKQGTVLFTGLSTSGEYVITVKSEEYTDLVTDPLVLRSNKTRSITLGLNKKKAVELGEIVVEANNSIARINTIDAEVSYDLKQQELESLPVEGRDITRALYRLPNVVQATGFFSEAPNVSINGSNSLFTNYLIDGLDNNEQFLGGQRFRVPTGFTQNINVLTNNYSAEFGQTGNGIVNVTTRSGTNELTGEAFFVTRPGEVIDASSEFAQRDLSGNLVDDGFKRYQFGFGLGGPIKKDKTFFYFNLEQTNDVKDNLLNVTDLGVNETIQGNNNFTLISGKLDHIWNNRWRSSLRVNTGFVDLERQGGGLDGGVKFPSAADEQVRNSINIAGKTSYQGSKFSSESSLLFGRFRWNFAEPQNPDSPNVTVLNPREETIALLGHPGFVFDEFENTLQFHQKFQWFKDNHSIKAGVKVLSSNHELFGGGNPNGSYTVKLNQQQMDNLQSQNFGTNFRINDIPSDVEVLNFGIELRPQSFEKRQNIYSLYVEDLYSVSNNLNLKFGLRYDYDNLSEGGDDSGDFNNIAPRTSINYTINNRSALRAGWGMFYDKILYAVFSDALQFSSNSTDFRRQIQTLADKGLLPADTDVSGVTTEGNLTASLNNLDFMTGPDFEELQDRRDEIFSNELRILNPEGYQNPRTHQFSLGYEYQVTPEFKATVDFTHTRTDNMFRLRDVNAPAPFDFNEVDGPEDVRSQEEADATRPVPIFTDQSGSFTVLNGDTLRGIARSVTITETEGKARYWAGTINLVKDRADDWYSFRLSYTASSLRNNTDDINFKAMDANNFSNEWGPGLNDRRHVLNGIVTTYPYEGLEFNVSTLLQSGQPVNRIPDATIFGTTDLNGDGRSFGADFVGNSDRSPGASRNSDRLPWSYTVDVGLEYLFDLAGNEVEFRGDVFNIFNFTNLGGFSNNATQSNQIQVGPERRGIEAKNAAPPRRFQFTVRYLF